MYIRILTVQMCWHMGADGFVFGRLVWGIDTTLLLTVLANSSKFNENPITDLCLSMCWSVGVAAVGAEVKSHITSQHIPGSQPRVSHCTLDTQSRLKVAVLTT